MKGSLIWAGNQDLKVSTPCSMFLNSSPTIITRIHQAVPQHVGKHLCRQDQRCHFVWQLSTAATIPHCYVFPSTHTPRCGLYIKTGFPVHFVCQKFELGTRPMRPCHFLVISFLCVARCAFQQGTTLDAAYLQNLLLSGRSVFRSYKTME